VKLSLEEGEGGFEKKTENMSMMDSVGAVAGRTILKAERNDLSETAEIKKKAEKSK